MIIPTEEEVNRFIIQKDDFFELINNIIGVWKKYKSNYAGEPYPGFTCAFNILDIDDEKYIECISWEDAYCESTYREEHFEIVKISMPLKFLYDPNYEQSIKEHFAAIKKAENAKRRAAARQATLTKKKNEEEKDRAELERLLAKYGKQVVEVEAE